ncbi:MAG: exodeoxyribonuclease VII large subunit [Candidatus Pacebacteria bacterium]|nr:exodeoxyribonuclease VII large subunit [Candidatus Paceibacterota bacterium]
MTKNEDSNNMEQPEMVFSVGEYIEAVNATLKKFKVKITGEVSSVKLGPTGHCYFTIKDSSPDKQGASALDCIAWKYDYQMCGVKLVEGLEVILSGEGRVYEANGRFSFVAKTIEPKGEGALKKAYDQLKEKLDKEGVFDVERKKPLPEYPQKIGVITSKNGAVINDLLTNLGQFGFKIKMADSRVEGQEAVADLLGAVRTFKKQNIDVLVIMRGGGSLESLQAFNNEMLVRAVADFPCPVIAAIGHDKDVPLLALVADYACSTPTAAANTINKSWEMAPLKISQAEGLITGWFNDFFDRYKKYESRLNNYFLRIEQGIANQEKFVDGCWQKTVSAFAFNLKEIIQKLYFAAQNIKACDPQNNLALGYCLARKSGRLVKTVDVLQAGDDFSLQMADGIVDSTVKKLTKE